MKEELKKFLNDASLKDLEGSKGAIVLIQFPKDIEECKTLIAELQEERKPKVLELEEVQKGYDDLFQLTFKQRFMKGKQIKAEKAKLSAKIGELAKAIARIDSGIGSYENHIENLTFEINKFYQALERINVEPKDVVAEYHRIKDMLERKERGELVEPAIEVQQPAKAEKKNDAVPEQNRKTYPKLTQRQKFEMRLAKTAKRSNGPDPTCMGPQNG